MSVTINGEEQSEGAADGAIVDGASAAIEATVLDLTSANPVAVAIVDSNGDQVSSFGGGTQYTEDAAAAANPVGTALIVVRADTPAGVASADGDNVAARGSNFGAQYVTLLDSAGAEVSVGGGTQYDEDTASASAQKLTMAGVVRRDTAATGAGTDGDRTELSVGATGRLWASATIDTAIPAGTNNIGDVDVLSVVPGTGATALGKAIDSAVGATDTGVAVLAIRDDSLSALTPAESDYVPLRVNSTGALHVTGGGGGTEFAEDAAHGSGDLGSQVLAVRRDANTSLVGTDGDYAPLQVSALGALKVAITEDSVGSATDTEDGSVAAAQSSVALVVALPYSYDGSAWTRAAASIFRSIDLDETEEEVKATAGVVLGMWATNTATATRFIKFYNATAANVTVGSTTPVITIGIPGNTTDDISGVFNAAHGITFGTAITVAATTAVADADTGAPGANEVIVNIFYK